MNAPLVDELQAALVELEPRFKALRGATGALQHALKLAAEERPEALLLQKSLVRLKQSALPIDSPALVRAVAALEAETDRALDALALDFAYDLRVAFEWRGLEVGGRPPTLVVDPLVLQLDVPGRRAQWLYGREALTRTLPLATSTILKAYDQQHKAIAERRIDVGAFLEELHRAWRELLDQRSRRPAGNRLNLVETYSKLVLNRQSARFWNAPSRATFKDYERPLFVRDLVSAQEAPALTADGRRLRLRLGVATKSQADNPTRSIWLPHAPLDGEYYSDVTFEEWE
jgi:hypothetical protein